MTTTVLLCADRVTQAPEADAETIIVEAMCSHPKRIGANANGADRLVLGLCRGDYVLGKIQTELRTAGFDPLGVPILDLPNGGFDSFRLGIEMSAAVARANAFPGSGPEHAKLTFPAEISRRSLLTLSSPQYLAAPAVDHELCAAGIGCRACVGECPQGALSWEGGKISYDKAVCQPCGRCVTTCPTGAIENPAVTPAAIQAQIEALGKFDDVAVSYTCERGHLPETTPGWYPVSVPCTGMLKPQWLLAPLLMGVPAVAALPCSSTGCPLGHDDIVLRTVDFCSKLLVELGTTASRVATTPLSLELKPLPLRTLSDPFGVHGGAEVAVALADVLSRPDVTLAHEAAPSGRIDIKESACTGCTQCAQACPTGALEFESNTSVSVSFDAALCTACSQCIPRCPELSRGAIGLTPVTDMAQLTAGRTVLFEQQSKVCERCGNPIATAPMMERIGDLLGSEHDATMALVSTVCIDCRGR